MATARGDQHAAQSKRRVGVDMARRRQVDRDRKRTRRAVKPCDADATSTLRKCGVDFGFHADANWC
jgi:hypothetical protein